MVISRVMEEIELLFVYIPLYSFAQSSWVHTEFTDYIYLYTLYLYCLCNRVTYFHYSTVKLVNWLHAISKGIGRYSYGGSSSANMQNFKVSSINPFPWLTYIFYFFFVSHPFTSYTYQVRHRNFMVNAA